LPGCVADPLSARSAARFNIQSERIMQTKPLSALLFAFALSATAQTYDINKVVVSTFAGSGFYGYIDGQGVQTLFNQPVAMVADTVGNLYVMDAGNGSWFMIG